MPYCKQLAVHNNVKQTLTYILNPDKTDERILTASINCMTEPEFAYTQMKADLPEIQACGYGLYSTGSNVNGSDFAKQFLIVSGNPEAVFVTLHNNVASDDGLDNQKNKPKG